MTFWVVIETGSNQSFIFASNKQRVNVGASQLVHEVGTSWVDDAVGELDDVRVVVAASGKALLLVPTVEQGRSIVSAVTRRALDEAPGLDVWGVVDTTPAEDPGFGPSLTRAHRLHAAWRSRRPSPALRSPTLPWSRPCTLTGAPAAALSPGSSGQPISASVDAAWRSGTRGRNRLSDDLDGVGIPTGSELDQGLDQAGWTAVIHADGNGVGQVFLELAAHVPDDEFCEQLTAFSTALDIVTRDALTYALWEEQEQRVATSGSRWVLPIVVGGDDVTLLVDARSAVSLTERFLRYFMSGTADDPVIAPIAQLVLGRAGLTAAAGIAITKPHHPFSDAYALAEDLCSSAKLVKLTGWDPRCSAYDVHVLRGSVAGGLTRVRLGAVSDDGRTKLWSGPHVVAPDGTTPKGGAEQHDAVLLRRARELVSPGGVHRAASATELHELRAALVAGGPAVERTLGRLEPGARVALDPHVRPGPGQDFTRLLDALELEDVAAR